MRTPQHPQRKSLLGGIMLAIFNYRRRRSLACALIGEVAATLEAIEGYDEIRHLEAGDDEAERRLAELDAFKLPLSTFYNGNVAQLRLFDAHVQRLITYFYTRSASLADHLQAFAKVTDDAELRKEHTRNAAAEISNTMNAGDDLLRALRPFSSRRYKPSITRA
jgi:hypothetical protein